MSPMAPATFFCPKCHGKRRGPAALKHMLTTFFDGSAAEAAAALVDGSAARLSAQELDQLQALIERARKEN